MTSLAERTWRIRSKAARAASKWIGRYSSLLQRRLNRIASQCPTCGRDLLQCRSEHTAGDPCSLTNCVCSEVPGWPQRAGAWCTHLYASTPKVTPR